MDAAVINRDTSLLESRFLAVCQGLLACLLAGICVSGLDFLFDSRLPNPLLLLLALLFAAILLWLTRRAMRAAGGTPRIFASVTLSLAAMYGFCFFIDEGRNLLWVLLFVFLCAFFWQTLPVVSERRVRKTACWLGSLFALSVFLGYQLERFECLEIFRVLHAESLRVYGVCFYLLRGLALAVFFATLLNWGFDALCRHVPCPGTVREEKKGTAALQVLGLTALFFLCWLPVFLAYSPGILSPDSIDEVYQQMGVEPLDSSNPLIHQAMIGLCLRLGQRISSLTLGVVLYTVLQMLFLGLCFALCIRFLYRRGVNHVLLLAAVAFYALYPVHGYYSITMWKDIPFAGCALLFSMLLIREAEGEPETPAQETRSTVLLIVVGFLFATIRHNGMMGFAVGLPLFALILRRGFKKYAIVFVSVLLLFFGGRMLAAGLLDPVPMRSAEALSIPLQQVARVAAQADREELGSEEFRILGELWPSLEELGEAYEPRSADAVKARDFFDSEAFDAEPLRYARAWLRLGLRHPVSYLEAALMNDYGYWYPNNQSGLVYTYLMHNSLGLKMNDRHLSFRLNLFSLFTELTQRGPLAILFSIGFLAWILQCCAALLALKGHRGHAAAMIPLGAIWLGLFGAAVYAQFRYFYAQVVCLPLFLTLSLCLPRKTKPCESAEEG